MEHLSHSAVGRVGAAWGLLGVAVVLGGGVASLGPHVLDLPLGDLGALHWLILLLWLAFMAIGKGWQGMHRGFVPSVISRARALQREPRLGPSLLAPLYCMRLVWAPRLTLALSWLFIAVIVVLILAIRQLPSPWREGVDAGVALGLAMGLVSLGGRLWQGRADS